MIWHLRPVIRLARLPGVVRGRPRVAIAVIRGVVRISRLLIHGIVLRMRLVRRHGLLLSLIRLVVVVVVVLWLLWLLWLELSTRNVGRRKLNRG